MADRSIGLKRQTSQFRETLVLLEKLLEEQRCCFTQRSSRVIVLTSRPFDPFCVVKTLEDRRTLD